MACQVQRFENERFKSALRCRQPPQFWMSVPSTLSITLAIGAATDSTASPMFKDSLLNVVHSMQFASEGFPSK